ncbi:MAG: 16S rRNA (guanine(527)-N(7))-methyltransferase RsmG [Chromatiales bacterium]|jgi:16S rRNA (guanine527-N7)-methyltransferase
MLETYDRSACRERLCQGMCSLGLAMDESQERLLLQFLTLLVKWNKAYNLTAVRDPLEMVGRHLLDSLAVLPHLWGQRCLDMGTGPGLPGIPLAIMRPQMNFVLLDSNGKKIRFVRQAVLELGLGNVEAVQQRLESYRPEEGFDTLIARAFTALPRMFELTARLRRPGTRLLAMKADKAESELAALDQGIESHVIPLTVPYTQGTRCLVEVKGLATD